MAKKGSVDILSAESDDDIVAWHDAAYARYEAALDAYRDASDPEKPSAEVDPAIKAEYEEARDELITGTQYWRQVGEQVGTRSGVGGDAYVEGEQA